MKTIQPSGSTLSRSVDDFRLITASFLAWGLAFAFGIWIAGRQLSKIGPLSNGVGPANVILIGLVVFGLMLAVHFVRVKVFKSAPNYSIKFLAMPGVFLALEIVLFLVLRL